MPAGRASMQMTLTSQGRSAAALTGALSGSGTVTLEAAKFAGLDPRAFEIAVRASDAGQARDETRLKQIVEPALAAGALSVGSVQMPFTIRDGRLRVSATTVDAQGVRAVISGGYDIPADQADIRAALALTLATPTGGRPEIQLFAAGTPDAMTRTRRRRARCRPGLRCAPSTMRRAARCHRARRAAASAADADLDSASPRCRPDLGPPVEPLTTVPLPGRDPRRAPKQPKAPHRAAAPAAAAAVAPQHRRRPHLHRR